MGYSVGILGSGFGLYGYLPAFYGLGIEVHTLERYQDNPILTRPKLREMASSLKLYKAEADLITSVDYLVLSRRPEDQVSCISNLVGNKRLKHIFLEKPLTPSVLTHRSTLELLKSMNIPFSVGYLFRYTSWVSDIQKLSGLYNDLNIRVLWKMKKPSGWKLQVDSGGGVFDYYLIHFIPLFIEQYEFSQFSKISDSQESTILQINYKSPFTKELTIRIQFSFSESPYFCVSEETITCSNYLYESSSPFSQSDIETDERVPTLRQYVMSIMDALRSKKVSDLIGESIAIEEKIIEFREQALRL